MSPLSYGKLNSNQIMTFKILTSQIILTTMNDVPNSIPAILISIIWKIIKDFSHMKQKLFFNKFRWKINTFWDCVQQKQVCTTYQCIASSF